MQPGPSESNGRPLSKFCFMIASIETLQGRVPATTLGGRTQLSLWWALVSDFIKMLQSLKKGKSCPTTKKYFQYEYTIGCIFPLSKKPKFSSFVRFVHGHFWAKIKKNYWHKLQTLFRPYCMQAIWQESADLRNARRKCTFLKRDISL